VVALVARDEQERLAIAGQVEWSHGPDMAAERGDFLLVGAQATPSATGTSRHRLGGCNPRRCSMSVHRPRCPGSWVDLVERPLAFLAADEFGPLAGKVQQAAAIPPPWPSLSSPKSPTKNNPGFLGGQLAQASAFSVLMAFDRSRRRLSVLSRL